MLDVHYANIKIAHNRKKSESGDSLFLWLLIDFSYSVLTAMSVQSDTLH